MAYYPVKGDIVRIKNLATSVLNDDDLFPENPSFAPDMELYRHKNLTIRKVTSWSKSNDVYLLEEDGGRFAWDTRWFIHVSREPITYEGFLNAIQ